MNAFKVGIIGAGVLLLSGCKLADTLTGYTASTLCSKVFLSDLPVSHIMKTDLVPATQGTVNMVKINIDYDHKTVKAKFSKSVAKAIYRDNLGCTLVGEVSENELREQTLPDVPLAYLDPQQPWPYGSAGVSVVDGVDLSVIEKAADKLFQERELFKLNTTSVLVAYKGKLVYERYAPEYQVDTPVPMFSVSKTVSAVLSGIMQEQGLLDVHSPAGLLQWSIPGDPRQAITPHHLMSMTSGLGSKDSADKIDPDLFDLVSAEDKADTFSQNDLFSEPGTAYHYNTGNYLIQSSILKDRLGGDLGDYYSYIHTELFRKIDINTAVVQADNSGNLALGMFTFMSPRDMARFGLLLENGGEWNSEQIVSKQWIDYMLTAVNLPNPWKTDYGVGIFPNTDIVENRFWPSLPEDAMNALGFRGVFVISVPSLDLVIVRTGDATNEDGILRRMGDFVKQVPSALPN